MTTNGGNAVDVNAASQAMTASDPPDGGFAQDAVLARRDRLVVFGNTKDSWRDEARDLAGAIYETLRRNPQ